MFIFTHIYTISSVLHSFLKIWIFIWFPLEFLVVYVFCWQILCFHLSKSIFILLSFLNDIFPGYRTMDRWNFYFNFNIIKNSFHKLTPISKTSLVFCIICFPEYNVLFSSGCFQNFFFIFDFQHFDYDVPRYYFLCIYSAWDCWAPWICYLYLTSNLRKFWTLFFQVVFLSHFLSSHFLGLILC